MLRLHGGNKRKHTTKSGTRLFELNNVGLVTLVGKSANVADFCFTFQEKKNFVNEWFERG